MDRRVQQLISARKAAALPSVPSIPAVPGVPMRAGIPTSMSVPTGLIGNVLAFLFYGSVAIFILFLLTTFIHFTVYPIFKISPSDSGFLPISMSQGSPSASDWCKKPAEANQKADLGKTQTCDFTVIFDVYINRSYSSVTLPRMLLYRADTHVKLPSTAKSSTLASVYNMSNLIVYVDSLKNDLYVSALTRVNGQITEEKIPKISNIPLDTAFRIGIVYMRNFIEVYVNGKLQSTTTLKGQPIECLKDFYAPPPETSKLAKVGNLYYWPRALSAEEARTAGPALSTDFFISKS